MTSFEKTLSTLLVSASACLASTNTPLPAITQTDSPTASPNAPLKVLSIGNSFSVNAQKHLKQIADSLNSPLLLGNAVIGGCSLERHWRNASTNGVQYSYQKKQLTLADYVEAEKWDIVTIQQASGSSRFPKTYEPFGSNLIAFIKKHAPQAEVVVHETWAYRPDESRIMKWGISTDQMYADLAKAYQDFAKQHGLRVIPGGDAFQLARQTPEWGDYTPANKKTNTPASGKTLQGKDGFHANTAGEYLLGCVWYEFLFKKDVRPAPYIPQSLSPEDATTLRNIAHKIVTEGIVPSVGK